MPSPSSPAPETVRLFHNSTLILPDRVLEDGALLTTNGRIEAVGSAAEILSHVAAKQAQRIDAAGAYLAPGYIDIHVHGGGGADFMDGTPDAVRTAARTHARHGTTTLLPTTTTGSTEQLDKMLHACITVRDHWSIDDGAFIGGIHFYGPYFAPEKVGAHKLEGRRNPDPDEYRRFFDLGIIRVATCAAELPGAEDFYREGHRRGYLLTCGHSNASWTEMQLAYDAGMRHVDHFWCAMSTVPSLRDRLGTPMQGSMEQFVLRYPEMSTEVIADGCHLSPELLSFALHMKGPDRLCLVTDANRAVDMPPGRYRLGPHDNGEWFQSDTRVGFIPGHGLASSVVGMDAMVRNMHRLGGASLPDAVRMASLTPARRAGLAADRGSLEPNKRADLLILDRDLNPQRIFIAGDEFTP